MIDHILAWLATYALHSTALLGAVALITILVKRDAWRDLLWKTALVGAVATATLQATLDLRPMAGRLQLIPAEEVPVPPGPGLAPSRLPPPGRELLDPGVETRFSDPGRKPGTPDKRWLVALWGFIALVLLGRLAALYLRVHRMLRDRRPVRDARALGMVAELRRNSGWWHPVRLTMTTRCATPIAWGGSEICVPEALLELPADELRGALAHELAHLARRDPWWQLAVGVIESLFFFQPLTYLARRRLREAAEHLSDDWAVRQTGSAMGLARCLAAVATWVAPGQPLPDATFAMAEGGSPLVRRVQRLLEGTGVGRTPALHFRVAVSVMLLAGVVSAAPAVSRSAQQPERTPLIRVPDESWPVERRLNWALERARAAGQEVIWLAYGVHAGVPDRLRIDSDAQAAEPARAPTIGDVFFEGKWQPRETAGDLGVLLRVRVRDRSFTVERAAGRSYDERVVFAGLPLYCLDTASPQESRSFLESLAASSSAGAVRTALVSLAVASTRRPEGRADRPARRDARRPQVPDSILNETLRTVFDLAPPELQVEAVEAIPRFPGNQAAELLRKIAAEHPRKRVRVEAIESMADLPASIAVPLLDSIVWADGDPDLAAKAGQMLGHLGDRGRLSGNALGEQLPLAVDALARARANARRYASGPDGDAVRRLARHLDHEPKHDADFVRDRATWALTRMDDAKLIEPLIGALREDDWRVRAFAASALGVAGDARAVQAVRGALADPHWRVQTNAAYAAGALGDRDAVRPLINLLHAPQWQVRAAAAENLGHLGDPEAIPKLEVLEGDAHIAVRDAAGTALSRLR